MEGIRSGVCVSCTAALLSNVLVQVARTPFVFGAGMAGVSLASESGEGPIRRRSCGAKSNRARNPRYARARFRSDLTSVGVGRPSFLYIERERSYSARAGAKVGPERAGGGTALNLEATIGDIRLRRSSCEIVESSRQ